MAARWAALSWPHVRAISANVLQKLNDERIVGLRVGGRGAHDDRQWLVADFPLGRAMPFHEPVKGFRRAVASRLPGAARRGDERDRPTGQRGAAARELRRPIVFLRGEHGLEADDCQVRRSIWNA